VGRVRSSDVARSEESKELWRTQFGARPKLLVPDFATIKEWQDWAKNLGNFTIREQRRLRIPELLKSVIERLPPEVWLPNSDILTDKESSHDRITMTGSHLPVGTGDIRNKLYTAFLYAERPAELGRAFNDFSGMLPLEHDFATLESGGVPEIQRFEIDRGGLTERERDVLYFLFPDEMLEWARRDVELQEGVGREAEWRDNVAFGGIAGFYSRVANQIARTTLLTVGGVVAAPSVAAFVAPRLVGVAVGELATAGTMAKLEVATVTGAIVGGGTSAVDEAIASAPALAAGDVSLGDYFGRIVESSASGAVLGAAFDFAGEAGITAFGKLVGLFRGRPSWNATARDIEAALERNWTAEGEMMQFGEHGGAARNRSALGVAGTDARQAQLRQSVQAAADDGPLVEYRAALQSSSEGIQSAHLTPQTIMKKIPGYKPKHALTWLIARSIHTEMDAYWQVAMRAMRSAGQTHATAREVFDIIAESINRVSRLTAGQKRSLTLRLHDEMFVDFGLGESQMLEIPRYRLNSETVPDAPPLP
jgi:hypothetical protein